MPAIAKPKDYDKWVLSPSIKKDLFEAFNLEQPVKLSPILKTGDRNEVLKNISNTSYKYMVYSGKRNFFLKRIPWYATSAIQVNFSVGLQIFLKECGLPVPTLMRAASGLLTVRIDREVFVLSEYKRGYRPEGTVEENMAAGRALANFHKVSQSFSMPALCETPFELARQHFAILNTCTLDHLDHNEAQQFSTVMSVLKNMLDVACEYAEDTDFALLPKQPNHGDYSNENLLFSKDRKEVVAIVDFDNCDLGSRLHDIVEGMMARAWIKYRPRSNNFSELGPQLDFASAYSFLLPYQTVSPLKDQEWNCIPSVLMAFVVETTSLGLIRQNVSPSMILNTLRYFQEPTLIAKLVNKLRYQIERAGQY